MGLPWLRGAICFLHKGGKTLFMDYRNYPHKIHEGKYSPPGGTYEESRDLNTLETGVRETLEEANIHARNLIYRGKVHFNNEQRTVKGKPMKINMTVDLYDCYDFDDSNARAMEEKEGRSPSLEWIADEQILQVRELHEGDRKMFEWLYTYTEFEGTIIQIGESLGSAKLYHATT